jgi:hypothetical protein
MSAVDVRFRDRSARSRGVGRKVAVALCCVEALLLVGVAVLHPWSHVVLALAVVLGIVLVTWAAAPHAPLPTRRLREQRDPLGDELARLEPQQWAWRHDAQWGASSSDGHVAAGHSVYLLRTVENDLVDGRVDEIRSEALALKRRLEEQARFPVWVNPVLVVWSGSDTEVEWRGRAPQVAVVHGRRLTDWIASRPTDIPNIERQRVLRDIVRGLPRASR